MAVSLSEVIGIAKKISTQISGQYQSIGVKSMVFIEPNIFRCTLSDNTTVIDIPIDNFNNYSLTDKAKVDKLLTNGLGDLYLNNKGIYTKPLTNSVLNYNKSIQINASDWKQDTVDTSTYTLTINHGLNNEHIVPVLWNVSDKLETIGMQRVDSNTIKLDITNPIDGELVLNYSTSDPKDFIGNIPSIKTEFNFATNTDRDTYFTNNPIALQNGMLIAVGTNPYVFMAWNGVDSPTTYTSASDSTSWLNQTRLIRGEKGIQGDKGDKGDTGESAYDIAVKDESFSGTKVEWLESLNSCLGKFASLADLKVAYPSGTDAYKFAIISTITGQVGIAFYDKTVSNWQVTVFASTNGSTVVTDDKSVGKNSLGNLQINGFENANSNTIPSKSASGEISYLDIKKNSTNAFTSIASKEYVDESIVGGLSIQNDYYDATTNTPNITTINTNGKTYGWIVSVGGTQTLSGQSITFQAFDLVVKTATGGYLKIHNGSTSWSSIIGDITTQTDLMNKLNEYAKIDDTDTTSAIKTYSIKHILELNDKKRKIFMQSDSPIGMVKDDLWIDTTSIPYSMSSYDGTSFVSIGSAGGTKINDWVASTSYKVGEYIVKDSLLYRCITGNSDAVFTPVNWILISGHMIKDGTSSFTKRTNLKFTGTGISVTDDSANDSTIITVNKDEIMTGATSTTAGLSGNVPQPSIGQQDYLLQGGATWLKYSDWKAYTPTIGATITAPAYSSSYTLRAIYKVVGKSLHISFVYYGGASGGGGGDGVYLFPIPNGYSINTAVTGIANKGDGLPVGNGFCYQSNANNGMLSVLVYDATRLKLLDHSANLFVGSSRYALNVGEERIAFTCEVPIS
jgi:hypothetical protein